MAAEWPLQATQLTLRMSVSDNAERLVTVGHGRPFPGAERQLYDLHRSTCEN